MKTLGIIPARGGSKGIPNKNLLQLGGKPLIAYTVEAARASGVIDRLILSTDSEAIAEIGRSLGVEVPFMRPPELASDDAPMLPVVQHAVSQMEQSGWVADIVVLLQPTSPLRRPERIQQAVELLKSSDCSSVVSVTEIPEMFAPQKAMVIHDRFLDFWSDDGESVITASTIGANVCPREHSLRCVETGFIRGRNPLRKQMFTANPHCRRNTQFGYFG